MHRRFTSPARSLLGPIAPQIVALLALVAAAPALADTAPAKLLRFPDIFADQVAFCYAGDIWKAPAAGGTAVRLTAHPGVEVFPKFSPDGKWIAFTGQYDGDEQVYVIPSAGGEPKKLTYYPAHGPLTPRWGYDNIVYGWTPDGKSILFRSLRYGYPEHDGQLYTVDRNGGPAIPLPMPRSGAADFSPDGTKLIYSPLWRDFRTWKRYQGGWAQDLYIYDLKTNQTKPVAHSKRTERDPIWIGDAIYFLSDRTGTLNLFKYDIKTDGVTQLTNSDTWDQRWASSDGKGQIVFERAGELVVYDVGSGRERPISIVVPDDGLASRPAHMSVGDQIEEFEIAPKGERALFAARGDIFTAPIENGPTRNLTRSSYAHDRAPRWSPDGKQIVFISDMSGEEEVYVVPQDGSAAPKALTSGSHERLYSPIWSPDSKRIVYSDKEGRIFVVNADGGKKVLVADERNGQVTDYAWSPCSSWLAFSLSQPTGNFALYIWGAHDGQARKVTAGFWGEHGPVWDPEGKYLWFMSERDYVPQISQIEWNFAANRMTGIFALALRKDVANPFAPLSDEVNKDDAKADEGGAAKEPAGDAKDKNKSKAPEKDKEANPKEPIKIDFDGLADRVARVPIEGENYGGLSLAKGFLFYVKGGAPFYGRDSEQKTQLKVYDLDKRKEAMLLDDVNGYALSADGKKLLVAASDGYALYDAAPTGKDSKKAVSTAALAVDRIPKEEWRCAFNEVWRRYRDFFYAPNMHGYDWEALRKQYAPLVDHVAHRSDLNYVIGEMIAELNVGHAYIEGGDWTLPKRAPVGLLGARLDFEPATKRYKLGKIWAGANEEPGFRNPLREIGVDVKEGEYLIAIDGRELTASEDPFKLLVDKADNPLELTISATADAKSTRKVKVTPTRDEHKLVYLDWVEKNRAYVAKQTGGKVAYMHLPDMGAGGAREFVKQFYPQARMNGMVVDDRSNGGGNISAWVIERLRRKLLGIEYARTYEDPGTYPDRVMRGPMACLISETSASDGDIFPYMFRQTGLGPLIGKRTWGGVVGISGHGPLIDGGETFVPQYGNMSKDGQHAVEGEGVSPDIEVENDPASEIAGKDPQLDRGIQEVMKELAKDPHNLPPRPADPVKTKAPLKN